MVLVAAGIGVLFVGVARLQLFEHDRYRDLAERNWLRLEILRAPRGRIFDRNGVLLADNAPAYSVLFRPPPAFSREPDTLSLASRQLLSAILALPDSAVRRTVRLAAASGLPMPLRRDAPFEVMAAVEERMPELPGVEVVIEPRRSYPESTRAAHLLGYAGEISGPELDSLSQKGYRSGDLIGRSGLERSYEGELRGTDGRKIVVVNASGRRVRLFEEEKPIFPTPGRDLVLTLDVRLQRALEQAMSGVQSGAAVALDPRDGGVLALVNRPSFDPNEFAHGLSRERWQGLVTDPSYPLLDRAIQAGYPPGSTFKVVTSLAGLGEHAFDVDTRFAPCGGGYSYGGRYWRCWEHEGHGSLTLVDALARSCDVFYYQAGLRLGLRRLSDWARKLDLGERTGIDLPQEKPGRVPTPEWYEARHRRPGGGVILNLAIGQGELLLTPLQLATLAATVANRGRVMRPHLMQAVRDRASGEVRRYEAREERRVDVDAADWETLVEAMEKVVTSGTGALARVPGVRVAGKTGTAQNPHGEDHALFIAFAPAEDPKVALAVVVENAGHGGSVAAPIAQRAIASYLLPEAPPKPVSVAAVTDTAHVDTTLIRGD